MAGERGGRERSIVVVRHGQTVANARGLLLGRDDPPLDERGLAQAASVAQAMAGGSFGRINRVISSPLSRARVTAEAIGSAVGSSVSVDPRLRELDYGEFEGTPVADVPVATWQRWQSDLEFCPPGGESIAQLAVRVRSLCGEVADGLDEPGAVVLVTHVSPIKAAVAWALGVGDEVCWRTHLDTASITRILVRGGRPVLDLFNQTSHLS